MAKPKDKALEKDTLIEGYVSDAMTQKPIKFVVTYEEEEEVITKKKVGKFLRHIEEIKEIKKISKQKMFEIHPPTFGKMQILSKLYLMLDINEKALISEPHIEAMRVCESKTDVVCRIIAISSLYRKEDLLNDELITEAQEFFKWNCFPSDFSMCLMAMLTQIDYENFISSIRLTKLLRLNKPKIRK